jgi:hypothetical protein
VDHRKTSLQRVERAALGLLVLAALGLRLWALASTGELSADEAVPGLMARHIVNHVELPVFYWGQDYFGALEAYLIAALFAVLGFHWWLAVVPALAASLLLIPLTWALAKHVGLWPAALIAAVPVALTPPVQARLLVSPGGGFSLAFALVCAALLCALRADTQRATATTWASAFALLTGFAGWLWQPALAALPPVLVVLALRNPVLRRPEHAARFALLLLIGLAPLLVHNLQRGWPTADALLRKYGEAHLAGGEPGARLLTLRWLLPLALGGGDENAGGANALQAGVVIGACLIAPLALWLRSPGLQSRLSDTRWIAFGLLLLVAVLHTLAAHQAARYLIPVALGAYCLAGATLARVFAQLPAGSALAVLFAGVVFGFGNLRLYADPPAPLGGVHLSSIAETQALVAALGVRGLTTGYADYWTAYPVAYLSAETIIVAPSVSFLWRARTDRYPPYTQQVDAVLDPARLFVLVDRRCSARPYVKPLEDAGAAYQADVVGRWLLVWDIQPSTGSEHATLLAWRSALAREHGCLPPIDRLY